jgi:hypothetical protein
MKNRPNSTELTAHEQAFLEEYMDLDTSDPVLSRRQLQECVNNLLRHRRNMTVADIERIHQKQEKKCAICQERYSRKGKRLKWMIDHDHNEPFLIRGVLCIPCNNMVDRYEKYADQFAAYIRNPPAQQVGLNLPFTSDPWRKSPPPSPNALKRLQNMLDRGINLRDLWRQEPDFSSARVRSLVANGSLRLPNDTVERIRVLLLVGRLKRKLLLTQECIRLL